MRLLEELFVDHARGAVGVVLVDEDGDLDLTRGDHMDVDVLLIERFIFQHARADDGDLGDTRVDVDVVKIQRFLIFIEQFRAGHDIFFRNGKDDVLLLISAERLNDHINGDLFLGENAEQTVCHTGHVFQTNKCKACDLLILRNTCNICFFHFLHDLLHNRTGNFLET